MKSFVTTAVAALVAANGALANSTDASTSGTVPELEDQCYFDQIYDGVMEYYPGEYSIRNNQVKKTIGGRWLVDKPAYIHVTHVGASELIVEATNKLVNSTTGKVYDVQVDYDTPQFQTQLGQGHGAGDKYYSGATNDAFIGSRAGKQVTLSSGAELDGPDQSWPYNTIEATVYENQANQLWEPNSNRGMDSKSAEDRVRFDLVEGLESKLYDQRYTHGILIGGMAWMVDGPGGVSEFDSNNHGLEDGNYYIEHNVTCLQ